MATVKLVITFLLVVSCIAAFVIADHEVQVVRHLRNGEVFTMDPCVPDCPFPCQCAKPWFVMMNGKARAFTSEVAKRVFASDLGTKLRVLSRSEFDGQYFGDNLGDDARMAGCGPEEGFDLIDHGMKHHICCPETMKAYDFIWASPAENCTMIPKGDDVVL